MVGAVGSGHQAMAAGAPPPRLRMKKAWLGVALELGQGVRLTGGEGGSGLGAG